MHKKLVINFYEENGRWGFDVYVGNPFTGKDQCLYRSALSHKQVVSVQESAQWLSDNAALVAEWS